MRAIRPYARFTVNATETFDGSTSGIDFGTQTTQNYAARTLVALIYPTGSGEGTSACIWAMVPSGSSDGPRFTVEHNSGNPHLQIRQGSTGTANFPARNAANGTITYNAWNLVAATMTGGLTASTDMKLYNGIGGATIAEQTYGGAANGTGSTHTGSGNRLFVGDRHGNDRSFLGDMGYVASFAGVLTLANLQTIQTRGPAAFYSQCTFLWSNGKDYGPHRLTGTATAVGTGGAPAFDNVLGFAGPLIGGRLAA